MEGIEKLTFLKTVDVSKDFSGLRTTTDVINELTPSYKNLVDEIHESRRVIDDNEVIIIFSRNGDVANEVAKIRKVGGADELVIVDQSILDKVDPSDVSKLRQDMLDQPSLLKAIGDDPNLVDAWKKLDDAGLAALRKDPVQLQKFDDIVKNNNLGLDADGLGDLLKAPTTKIDAATGLQQKWDNPDKVLDAVKRTSDANVPGVSIDHKKFPAPSEGSDPFVLKNAKQYQAEASGDAGLSFDKGGRSFDNVATDGKLIDRKYGHGSSVFNADGTVHNQSRANSILDQGRAQITPANGTPVKWEVSTELGADGIQDLFDARGIDIEVVYVPQQTIIN